MKSKMIIGAILALLVLLSPAWGKSVQELEKARDVKGLIQKLRDKDWDVRKDAAKALGKIGAPAVEPLIAALRDKDSDVRYYAAYALGEIGDKRAVKPLIAALRDKDSDVRYYAAEALGKIGDRRAVEPLIAALRDKNSDIRYYAAYALGEIGDKRAVKPLIAALGDKDSDVRAAAAASLGEIGDKRAVKPLISALRDKYSYVVRWRAAVALGKIGDKRAVKTLIVALRDKDSWLRETAAEVLGKIGDKRAVKPLIAALGDKDYVVRGKAAEALEKIDPNWTKTEEAKRHVSDLVCALTNWNIKELLASALVKLGWSPKTQSEKVHLWVAQEKGALLKNNWEMTKKVLLKDVDSGNKSTIAYALYTFIALGKKEIIPELIFKLIRKGTVDMAKAYLNCGNKQLHDAAEYWADRHGYTVIPVYGSAPPVSWGNW